ncbi:MAG: hypothetical protein Q4B09_06200 [Lachnospiraceae bacterium]|nr:hypothetical protein [Lachnospiraceae bacterium]
MNRKSASNNRISIIVNLLIGFFSFAAWLFMAVLKFKNGHLAANGFASLRYYTVLSNLMNGFVSLVYSITQIRGKAVSLRLQTAKLASAAAVTLTFLTVMCMLGPLYGYHSMFLGANLWMHLILPVLTVIDVLFLAKKVTVPGKRLIAAALPTLLYEIGYVLNMLINGVGRYPKSNDFYGFLNWGYGAAALIAAVMLLLTYVICRILWRLGGYRPSL